GLTEGFVPWAVWRTLAGLVSAWVFVFASARGFRRLAETGAPALQGLIYTGPGIGIVVTGLLGEAVGIWGSPTGWIGYGLLGLLIVALVWRIFDDGAAEPGADGAPRVAGAPVVAAGRATRRDEAWLIG